MNRSRVVVATGNRGKLGEILELLGDLSWDFAPMSDFAGCPVAEENFATYVENAREKATMVARYTGTWALADDSGLEVAALGGRPGVRSARYAGLGASDADNRRRVLHELEGVEFAERQAAFQCCVVLVHPDGREWVAQGALVGRIAREERGLAGFGYDAIFEIPRLGKTLAEIPADEKNRLSHRHQALTRLRQEILPVIL